MTPFTNDRHGRRVAWAFLSAAADGPSLALLNLVRDAGPCGAADALLQERGDDQGVIAARAHLLMAERIGARLVTPDDGEWPSQIPSMLPSTATAAPALPPLCLWVVGARSLQELTQDAVTVTEARACTSYGRGITTQIASELAADGWAIIAGGGFGIDAAAHSAALAAGAPTVAILACGIDIRYPAGNTALLDRIASVGALITEHPPGTTFSRARAAARARLLPMLAQALVIPEAGMRSGARAAAAHAHALDRPVFAVPGPADSPGSAGCHTLIRAGQARLATCADDVLNGAGS